MPSAWPAAIAQALADTHAAELRSPEYWLMPEGVLTMLHRPREKAAATG
jgi:hypothetical protein